MDRRSFVTGLVVGGAVGAGAVSVLNKPKQEEAKPLAAPAVSTAGQTTLKMQNHMSIAYMQWLVKI